MKCLACGRERETEGHYCEHCGSIEVGDWDTAEGRVTIFEQTLEVAKSGGYSLTFSGPLVLFSREVDGFDRVKQNAKQAEYVKGNEIIALPLGELNNAGRGFEVGVVCADSFEAAKRVTRGFRDAADAKPPLVLNFANPHFPGGGVTEGAKAQEEDLCRRSTLYLSLTSDDAVAFYATNKMTGDYFFTDDMVLSPHVYVFRDGQGRFLACPFEVAVLTISAPYAKGIPENQRARLGEIIERRIEVMLRTAAHYGYDRLVLGAWGCGAFGNDPEVVANAFYKVIGRMIRLDLLHFEQITFAIPNKESANYKTFKRVLTPTSILPVIEPKGERRKLGGHALQSGDVLEGRYRILDEIGRGGMSRVLLAADLKLLGKYLVLKETEIHGVDLAGRPVESVFDREAQLLSRLDHPGIVSIHDVIKTDDYFYIALDYVEGQSLARLCREEGSQSEEDVLNWMLQLCDVLGYLHAQYPTIIYRDIKPQNILLRKDGRIMLKGLFAAREYKDGAESDTIALGTEGFAAPEAYGGAQTDERSDIYGMGAMMWNLFTGSAPPSGFPLPNVREHMPEGAPRVSDALADVIIPKCTALDRAERYQSCEELAYDLKRVDEINRMIELRCQGIIGRFRSRRLCRPFSKDA